MDGITSSSMKSSIVVAASSSVAYKCSNGVKTVYPRLYVIGIMLCEIYFSLFGDIDTYYVRSKWREIEIDLHLNQLYVYLFNY